MWLTVSGQSLTLITTWRGMRLRRYGGLAADRKVASSIPGSSSLSVEVSLCKAVGRLACLTPPSVCECVHRWVNVCALMGEC